MTEERKHAILLATVILTARKLQPILEEDDREGNSIHFDNGYVLGGIPPGLAVQETITIREGGLNLYHSTAKLRVEIISYEGGE